MKSMRICFIFAFLFFLVVLITIPHRNLHHLNILLLPLHINLHHHHHLRPLQIPLLNLQFRFLLCQFYQRFKSLQTYIKGLCTFQRLFFGTLKFKKQDLKKNPVQ